MLKVFSRSLIICGKNKHNKPNLLSTMATLVFNNNEINYIQNNRPRLPDTRPRSLSDGYLTKIQPPPPREEQRRDKVEVQEQQKQYHYSTTA